MTTRPENPTSDRPGRPTIQRPSPKRRWAFRISALVLGLVAATAVLEFRASLLSARAFAARARAYSYVVEPGAQSGPLTAPRGPYDLRLGYADLPVLLDSAHAAGFVTTRQARPSTALAAYVAAGLPAPYEEKSLAGLDVIDQEGRLIFRHRSPRWAYSDFDEMPEPVWRTLAWVEDRELTLTGPATRNPAVDWDRMARAFLELGLSMFDRDRRVPGGSTLATQMEKFRHSPEGRTQGLKDKWRQMVSASTRAYRQGPNTLEARRQILMGYVNSVPLAARPGWGEVTGIGEGLRLWFGVEPDSVNVRLRRMVDESGPEEVRAYAQVLSLILAERRPSYYLRTAEGRVRLATLVEEHGRLLGEAGVVSRELGEALTPAPDTVRDHPVASGLFGGSTTKAATQIRNRLLPLTGAASLYDLDRLDLVASATYDSAFQAETRCAPPGADRLDGGSGPWIRCADPSWAERSDPGPLLRSPYGDPRRSQPGSR